jgi:hypothetical protein
MTNVWKTLSAIDCSKNVEKKGDLSYLSWAWAWQTLMEHYPDSTYAFCPPIFLDNETCEVHVSVTVEGKTHSMFLPVMDNRNKSIANPSTRDISDARMRCLVKAIAMHGLGIYIYAGEDLPEAVAKATVSKDQITKIINLIDHAKVDMPKFMKWLKVDKIDHILASNYDRVIAALEAKL